MDKYSPRPLDTSDVKLNKSLVDLTEELARNTHETWAKNRMAEGWKHGKTRDDSEKTHPCLMEYDNLPESEKKYDRDTALETLKVILKLGYLIKDPKETANGAIDTEAQMPFDFPLRQASQMEIHEAIAVWVNHDKRSWKSRPDIYLQFAQRLLALKAPLLAFDILTEGIESFGDIHLVKQVPKETQPLFLAMWQQRALALAESGATEEANRGMAELKRQGFRDAETLGILARTFKNLATKTPDLEKSREYLKTAFKTYHDGYRIALVEKKINGACYNGINAATLALLFDAPDESRALAESVKDICAGEIEKLSKKQINTPYWIIATLAEAELLLDNLSTAKALYKEAAQREEVGLRGRESMRRQVRLILEKQGRSRALLDSSFFIPNVVVFSGHMVDHPNRSQSRFPVEIEGHLREEIKKRLSDLNAGIGYASAACGSDIIFLEEMVARKAEINIVLPVDKDVFRRKSVDIIPQGDWGDRFDRLLKKAARVWTLTRHNPLHEAANSEFSNLFLYGVAKTRAQIVAIEMKALAVWDGNPGDGPGGTACAIEHWRRVEQPFDHIDILSFHKAKQETIPAPKKAIAPVAESLPEGVSYHSHRFMLFADVREYSKLSEDQIVRFSTHFQALIQKILAEHDSAIALRKSLGDGQFFVFTNIESAIEVALKENELLAKTDWTEHGLPAELSARFALDAGPCYEYMDPITRSADFCGSYVIRAARIEPITPPNHVYASETFVALARAHGVTTARFDYVGIVTLPKNQGTIPAYHVRRA